jgi:hypothetical protein
LCRLEVSRAPNHQVIKRQQHPSNLSDIKALGTNPMIGKHFPLILTGLNAVVVGRCAGIAQSFRRADCGASAPPNHRVIKRHQHLSHLSSSDSLSTSDSRKSFRILFNGKQCSVGPVRGYVCRLKLPPRMLRRGAQPPAKQSSRQTPKSSNIINIRRIFLVL